MLSRNQAKLITSLHHKKYRKEENLFIAEGEKVVSDLLASDNSIHSVYCTEDFVNRVGRSSPFFEKLQMNVISEEELSKISALSTAQHVLAVAEIPKSENEINFNKGLKLVLDEIKDPGNLGTLIRTSDWFGITEIICSEECVDCYNPKVVQAAMGSLFRMNISYKKLGEIFTMNNSQNNLPVYGTMLKGKSIYKEELSQNGFIIIGSESTGISVENIPFITHPLTIPASSSTKADSLNAAIAAGIICSEFSRRK